MIKPKQLPILSTNSQYQHLTTSNNINSNANANVTISSSNGNLNPNRKQPTVRKPSLPLPFSHFQPTQANKNKRASSVQSNYSEGSCMSDRAVYAGFNRKPNLNINEGKKNMNNTSLPSKSQLFQSQQPIKATRKSKQKSINQLPASQGNANSSTSYNGTCISTVGPANEPSITKKPEHCLSHFQWLIILRHCFHIQNKRRPSSTVKVRTLLNYVKNKMYPDSLWNKIIVLEGENKIGLTQLAQILQDGKEGRKVGLDQIFGIIGRYCYGIYRSKNKQKDKQHGSCNNGQEESAQTARFTQNMKPNSTNSQMNQKQKEVRPLINNYNINNVQHQAQQNEQNQIQPKFIQVQRIQPSKSIGVMSIDKQKDRSKLLKNTEKNAQKVQSKRKQNEKQKQKKQEKYAQHPNQKNKQKELKFGKFMDQQYRCRQKQKYKQKKIQLISPLQSAQLQPSGKVSSLSSEVKLINEVVKQNQNLIKKASVQKLLKFTEFNIGKESCINNQYSNLNKNISKNSLEKKTFSYSTNQNDNYQGKSLGLQIDLQNSSKAKISKGSTQILGLSVNLSPISGIDAGTNNLSSINLNMNSNTHNDISFSIDDNMLNCNTNANISERMKPHQQQCNESRQNRLETRPQDEQEVGQSNSNSSSQFNSQKSLQLEMRGINHREQSSDMSQLQPCSSQQIYARYHLSRGAQMEECQQSMELDDRYPQQQLQSYQSKIRENSQFLSINQDESVLHSKQLQNRFMFGYNSIKDMKKGLENGGKPISQDKQKMYLIQFLEQVLAYTMYQAKPNKTNSISSMQASVGYANSGNIANYKPLKKSSTPTPILPSSYDLSPYLWSPSAVLDSHKYKGNPSVISQFSNEICASSSPYFPGLKLTHAYPLSAQLFDRLFSSSQFCSYFSELQAIKINQYFENIKYIIPTFGDRLRIVNLANNNIRSIGFVRNWQAKVEFVNFSDNFIRNIGDLLSIQSLVEIHVRNNCIDHVSFNVQKAVSEHSSQLQLKLIDLSHNRIQKQEDLWALAKIKSLKMLNLLGNSIMVGGFKSIQILKKDIIVELAEIYIFSQFTQFKDIAFGPSKNSKSNKGIKNQSMSQANKDRDEMVNRQQKSMKNDQLESKKDNNIINYNKNNKNVCNI